MEKQSISSKLLSGDFYGQSFIKTVRGPLITSLPTYPKFCWYATGTTHIFHLGLMWNNIYHIRVDPDLAALTRAA